MYTNLNEFGGSFLNVLDSEFQNSSDVFIASGYVSLNIINRYFDKFEEIATNGGLSRLLLGMAFYEGLSSPLLNKLIDLNSNLINYNDQNGVLVSHGKRYHGKIYIFKNNENIRCYVGSSNFSDSGLLSNIECMLPVNDHNRIVQIESFLEYISNSSNSLSISDAEILERDTQSYQRTVDPLYLDRLKRFNIDDIDISNLPFFDISLERIAEKKKSNLNAYFGKGRLNRSTGKIKPRPWYEVELIANKEVTSNPLYPIGDFTAYTDDGYIIPMRTQGDYNKNIRSKNKLVIFGMWIKGKLQKSNALIPLTPVTRGTLESYGNNKITFYKIRDREYYISF
ncbi:restriction endonuclease PLD domain-containing protein [candidate division KSB1 bacterium]